MAVSKELLTDILDGVTVVQGFLLQDLSQESLSPACETRRQNVSKAIEGIIAKIRHSHPSIRPRVNTPGGLKKPAPPPPLEPPSPAVVPEGPEEGELYEEAQQAEEYLSFEPANSQGEEPQEMYEAMENMQDQEPEQDVYDEPGINLTGRQSSQDNTEAVENYEDPISSRPSTASLPTIHSQENSGSGAEYAEAIRREGAGLESTLEMSTYWSDVYTMPSKGDKKIKVSALKNILIKGYLEKLGGRNQKTWQKRYCVLAGPFMYFYEKENSRSYNNYIALLTFKCLAADNMSNEKRNQFAFKLSHQDSSGKAKDYYFRTNSADVRNKWLGCMSKVLGTGTPPTPRSAGPTAPNSATLPRMPSQVTTSSFTPMQRQRTLSAGETQQPEELYEDMAIPEEAEEDQDEYVAISPADQPEGELESSEEYVDVTQQQDGPEEQYEDTTPYQPHITTQPPPPPQPKQAPPPPLSPPPGPPSPFFTDPPLPPRPNQITTAPPPPRIPAPPPPEPEVDTDRIYEQPTTQNGIKLQQVFVSLWDFVASEDDELALKRGDLVYVSTPQSTAEWWFGELLDAEASTKMGRSGYFPRAYSTIAFDQVS